MRSKRQHKVEQWIELAAHKVPHVFIKCSSRKVQQLMSAMRRNLTDLGEHDLLFVDGGLRVDARSGSVLGRQKEVEQVTESARAHS